MFRNFLFAVTFFCSVQNYALQAEALSKIDRENALSRLVQASQGSTADLPLEAKALVALHPISQRLAFSHTDLVFEQEFTEEKPDGTRHRFHKKYYIPIFSKFKLCPDKISICFKDPACTIKFSSMDCAQQALTFLTDLQQQALKAPSPNIFPSELAKEHGYTYLIVSPRGESFQAMIDLLKTSSNQTGKSSNLWCWLTKQPIDAITELLNEGSNRLPLFIYSLNELNSAEFFLTSNLSGTQVLYTDPEAEKIQSATSQNSTSLSEFLKVANRSHLVFQKCPDLSSPLQIYLSSNQRGQASRLKFPEYFTTKPVPTKTIKPLYNNERPLGTAIKWVKGKSYYSSDSLIYALNTYSFSDLSDFLEFEYPSLHYLALYPSTLDPLHTILHRARELDSQLNPNRNDLFTRIALLAYELGKPFGPQAELKLNGYPLFLSLLEQTGLQATYGPIIEWYYSQKIPQNKLSTLFYIDRLSYQTFLPRDTVLQALLTLEAVSGNTNSPLKSVQSLANRTKIYFTGRPNNAPHFPLRQMFSSYYWEKIDPLHHAGLTLEQMRNQFETDILRKPHSNWFGHFFDWLKPRIKNKPSTLYLEPSERGQYIGKFNKNTILTPHISFPSDQVLFVIDEDGHIYLGLKDEGTPTTKAFAHSTFLAGGSVISAGKVKVDKSGKIQEINTHTGHYRSGKAELEIANRIFQEHGVTASLSTH